MSKELHIAVLMMLKNEKARLHVSLESIKNFADSLVVFDTGSTDNTIEICENFCKKYNIKFRLKQGEFVNFCISRNESLDFADSFTDIDYILLMDCNDELREGYILRNEAKKYLDNKDATSFLLTQEWFSGNTHTYYNMRFIKPRNNWRYTGVVHEYLKNDKDRDFSKDVKIDSKVRLYQDRTKDDDKTGKRFKRDVVLLLDEYKKDPTEPRTCFYLAQTYSCLGDNENAYYYYKQRIDLIGFWEEVYHCYLKCGELSQKLNHDWYDSFKWYMKAYEYISRAEPLINISEYYVSKENWLLAYTFIDLACKLNFPDHCILFVDKFAYDYKRWHLLGKIGYYAGFYKEGKVGCLKAIEFLNSDLDKSNLQFYLDKEKEIGNEPNVNLKITKNQFIDFKVNELKKKNPKLSQKQLIQQAKIEWKNRMEK